MDVPPHEPSSDLSNVAPVTDDEHRSIIDKRLKWITDRIDGLKELRHRRRDSSSLYEGRFQLGQKVWKRSLNVTGMALCLYLHLAGLVRISFIRCLTGTYINCVLCHPMVKKWVTSKTRSMVPG